MSSLVRKARHGDEEGIHSSHMQSIQQVCAKDYTQEQIQAWGGREYNFEQKRNLIDNHHVWVVEEEGKIKGYGLLFIGEKGAEIGGLYFLPSVLGRGHGRQIVNEMLEVAKEAGFKEVTFESTVTSKGFYERMGAYQYAEDENSPINGVPIEGHPMRIDL